MYVSICMLNRIYLYAQSWETRFPISRNPSASTVNMTYIIRHVRTLQQAEYDGLMNARQLDGELNPTDPLTKHKPKQQTARHFAFLMGYPVGNPLARPYTAGTDTHCC